MKEMDDFDWSELLPDFIGSAKENMEAVSSGLLKLEENGGDRETLEEIYRRAHSLKGSSLTIGFKKMGKLAHAMEDILKDFWQQNRKPTPGSLRALFRALDQIDRLLQEIADCGEERSDITRTLEQLNNEMSKTGLPPSHGLPSKRSHQPTKAATSQRISRSSFSNLRVPANELDAIFNLVNETVASRDNFHKKITELKALVFEFQKHVKALCKNLYDSNAIHPLNGIRDTTLKRLKELTVELEEECDKDEARVKEIQQRIMKIRMLPLSVIMNALKRNVRDLAQQFQKEIEFEIQGAETRVDKSILEELLDPLIHLMRNCIDHGIETVEQRKKEGKNPRGLLRLAAYHSGGKVVIEVEDDGKGIDFQRVKAKALEKGLVKEEALPNLTDKDLLNFIFLPGFSTRTIITDISGRGVGLDVVKNNIERLKGSVEVAAKENQGTKFTLSFPLTLMTDRAVLVRVAGRIWAIPSSFVERFLRCSQDEIRVINNKRALLVDERVVPVVSMDSALGYVSEQPHKDKRWLETVILNTSQQRIAFEVDELLGDQEIVVKSLGPHLKKVDKIAGATILAGQIALIVDASRLIHSAPWREIGQATAEISTGTGSICPSALVGEPRLGVREKPWVLVVEDQLTTQQLEKSILEAAGFLVDTARDGVEAVEKLSGKTFDAVVTDIKMPNMDGLSLTRYIKSSDRYRHIPVIMVSAMEKEEDKKKGMQVGADAYIVKSRFEQGNLIDTVKLLIEQ